MHSTIFIYTGTGAGGNNKKELVSAEAHWCHQRSHFDILTSRHQSCFNHGAKPNFVAMIDQTIPLIMTINNCLCVYLDKILFLIIKVPDFYIHCGVLSRVLICLSYILHHFPLQRLLVQKGNVFNLKTQAKEVIPKTMLWQ